MRACRNCHYISKEEVCPLCGSEQTTEFYSGEIIILDVDKSEVAKLLNIKTPGAYAINVK